MKQTTLIILAVLGLAACGGEPEKTKEVSIKVEGDRVILAEPDKATFLKTEVVKKDSGDLLRLPGRLVWDEERTVRVFPQLGGRVLRIQAEVGAPVKAGQALATLASPDFGVAEAEARKAEADRRLTRQTVERNKELLEAGVIARKDWQQVEADAAKAEAEAERAGRRLASLGGAGAGGSYVVQSPLAGVVVERNLNPGQEFRPDQAATPLFVVTDPTRLWIQLDAAEGSLAGLKPGMSFALETKQYPGERFSGVIRHVADFVDPVSRTIKVRGEVPNPDRRLKGELFVTALVDLPAGNHLRLPAKAVFLMGEQRFVLVEEAPGRYLRRRVEVGAERDGWAEVDSGVAEGEKVVVEGNLHLIKFIKAAEVAQAADKGARP